MIPALTLMALVGSCLEEPSCSDADIHCNPLVVLAYTPPAMILAATTGSSCRFYLSPNALLTNGRLLAEFSNCSTVARILRTSTGFAAVGVTPPGECLSWHSPDGLNWSATNCLTAATTGLQGMVQVNGRLIALGRNSGTGTVRISNDGGLSWTSAATGRTVTYNTTGYFNGRFLGGGTGGLDQSTDPATVPFAQIPAVIGTGFWIESSADRAVLVGLNPPITAISYYSLDGLNWSAGTGFFANVGSGGDLPSKVIYHRGSWLAAGGVGIGAAERCFVDQSPDGIQWSGGGPLAADCDAAPMVLANGMLVSLGPWAIASGGDAASLAYSYLAYSVSGRPGDWALRLLNGELFTAGIGL